MSVNNFIEITSVNNEIVKETAKLQQKKYRLLARLVVLEGEKSVLGAIEDGLKIESIFFTNKETAKEILSKTNEKQYLVNEKVMAKISSTASAPEILAIAREPVYDIEQFLKMKKIVLLNSVKDAGNLGTIIRSAAAFGIEGILLFGECVDEYSPKVIRSSAGNIFKIPIVHMGSDIRAIQKFKNSHKIIMTVVSDNAKDARKQDYSMPFILMLGSEASGLCNELLTLEGEHVTLSMDNCVESLNLSVFAGIMFYIIHYSN